MTTLPGYFDAVDVQRHDEPISAHVEIARWLADEERRTGTRPVTLFTRVREYPRFPVLGNPCPKEVLLAAMDLPAVGWPELLERRLSAPEAPGVRVRPGSWTPVGGLDELPVVQHRPGDAGRYVTAGVCVTRSPEGVVNLGVYRIQVAGDRHARIFFDPRTDAHRNWRLAVEAGRSLPVTVFLGANPVLLLAAASRLPEVDDELTLASRLLGRPLDVDPELQVPVDSTFVLRGRVSGTTEEEGPFAEFKGYYTPSRMSPVLTVDEVLARDDAYYPTIVTGAASGLSLMALQNEYLMFTHLRARGHEVGAVSYPLSARSEFVALISSPAPSPELLDDAMTFDPRTKLVLCGDVSDFPLALASHGLTARTDPYYRKGSPYGDRVGMLFDRLPDGEPVEF